MTNRPVGERPAPGETGPCVPLLHEHKNNPKATESVNTKRAGPFGIMAKVYHQRMNSDESKIVVA
jgi:hypothetical protein